MATDLCKGVYNQILLKKRLKMTKSSNKCQSFRITAKALKLLEVTLHFMYFSEKQFLFGVAYKILGRDKRKIRAKKEEYLIFPGFWNRIRPNSP